jgi:hypothetical protein
MPRAAFPELLLARVTGRDRAVAIMGDLEELAHIRGRGWFWTTYLRTVVTFAWRPSVAFLFGYFSFLVATLVFQRPWVGPGAGHRSLLTAMLQNDVAPLLPFAVARLIFPIAGPLLVCIMIPLRFVFPYAAVRYGPHDRFVQLAGAAYLITTLMLVYPPVLSPVAAVTVVLGFATALILPLWRMPMMALAATLATGLAAVVALFGVVAIGGAYLMEQLPHPHILYKSEIPSAAISFFASLVAAIVCSSLHARLLRSPQSGDAHAEPA